VASSSTYRSSYRVEQTVRPASSDELALVRERRRVWRAMVKERELGPMRELLVALIVAIGALVFGLASHNVAVAIAGGAMTVMLLAVGLIGRRNANARIARSRGPWEIPDAGLIVRDTRVIARSVVGAVTDDEEYGVYLLFEIPGGDWFFVDPLALPVNAGPHGSAIARADVRLTSIEPDGVYIAADATGDPIPHRGARATATDARGEDFARDVERGFVWAPEQAWWKGNADGLVPEERLPAWMRGEIRDDTP
jgi:hypothetical protein